MAKVYLICGKICSGKTTYSVKLCTENRAILLSVDEIMLSLFGRHCGDKHEEYADKAKSYLLNKSLEFIDKGVNVVLDWGFWSKVERNSIKEFFNEHSIDCELHYIDISDEVWRSHIAHRNKNVLTEEIVAYYIDNNLAIKFASLFEVPSEDEIDIVQKQ